MKYRMLVPVLLLAGCGDPFPSNQITPEIFARAEVECAANAGVSRVWNSKVYLCDKKPVGFSAQVVCKNTAQFTITGGDILTSCRDRRK